MKWICVVLCCITLGAVMIDVWMFHGGTVQAQGGQTVYVQLVLGPVRLAAPNDISTVKIKGTRVVGFSCTSTAIGGLGAAVGSTGPASGPTCYVASAP